eukprot:1179460-Prorocentrum_minimum.AAC.6
MRKRGTTREGSPDVVLTTTPVSSPLLGRIGETLSAYFQARPERRAAVGARPRPQARHRRHAQTAGRPPPPPLPSRRAAAAAGGAALEQHANAERLAKGREPRAHGQSAAEANLGGRGRRRGAKVRPSQL